MWFCHLRNRSMFWCRRFEEWIPAIPRIADSHKIQVDRTQEAAFKSSTPRKMSRMSGRRWTCGVWPVLQVIDREVPEREMTSSNPPSNKRSNKGAPTIDWPLLTEISNSNRNDPDGQGLANGSTNQQQTLCRFLWLVPFFFCNRHHLIRFWSITKRTNQSIQYLFTENILLCRWRLYFLLVITTSG